MYICFKDPFQSKQYGNKKKKSNKINNKRLIKHLFIEERYGYNGN